MAYSILKSQFDGSDFRHPGPRASDIFSAMSAEIPAGYHSRCATGDPSHPKVLAASGNDAPTRSSPDSSPHSPARTSGVRSALALAFLSNMLATLRSATNCFSRSFSCRGAFTSSLVGATTSPRHEGWSERHRALRIEGPIDWGPGYREQHYESVASTSANFQAARRCIGAPSAAALPRLWNEIVPDGPPSPSFALVD